MKTFLTLLLACLPLLSFGQGVNFSSITRTNTLTETNLFLTSTPVSGGTRTIYFSDLRNHVSTNLGAAQATTLTVTNNVVIVPSTLTSAASTSIDFSVGGVREITVAHNITFTSANLSHGVPVTLILAADGTDRTLTFPAWIFVGASAPALLPAGKTAVMWLYPRSAADTNVIASYTVQP